MRAAMMLAVLTIFALAFSMVILQIADKSLRSRGDALCGLNFFQRVLAVGIGIKNLLVTSRTKSPE